MEQFAASVNEFLEFRRYDILDGNGKVSRDLADEKAFGEYEIFNRTYFPLIFECKLSQI